MSTFLIHLAVLVGVAVVAPAALGGPRHRWWAAAGLLAVSFALPTSRWTALLTAPLLALSVGSSLVRARLMWTDRGRTMRASNAVIDAITSGCAVVSAVALAHSRAGVELGGIGEPIVELTGVHFLFAGVGALTLARRTRPAARHHWPAVRAAAITCTACAPPLVACGFVRRLAMAQVGGAVVMSVGVCLTAALHLHEARSLSRSRDRLLLAISGMAVWVPMVFAVAWAAAQYWDVPAFSVAVMVPAHGLPNAIAFILCGLAVRRPELGQTRPSDHRALVTA